MSMERIVVLGATSAIARAVERILAAQGKQIALVGRDPERLQALCDDLLARGAKRAVICVADLADLSQQAPLVTKVREAMPDFDTLLLAYGTLLEDAQYDANRVSSQLATDFVSAASLLTLFAPHFEARKSGCIAVITSVAGDRGRRPNYVYGAAKGGLSIFLQGLRSRLFPAGVAVITIKPGPVQTPMTAHMKKSTGFAQPDAVARAIVRALERRRPDVLYTPAKWRLIMAIARAIPESIFKRLSF